jgi:hypothetical protein
MIFIPFVTHDTGHIDEEALKFIDKIFGLDTAIPNPDPVLKRNRKYLINTIRTNIIRGNYRMVDRFLRTYSSIPAFGYNDNDNADQGYNSDTDYNTSYSPPLAPQQNTSIYSTAPPSTYPSSIIYEDPTPSPQPPFPRTTKTTRRSQQSISHTNSTTTSTKGKGKRGAARSKQTRVRLLTVSDSSEDDTSTYTTPDPLQTNPNSNSNPNFTNTNHIQ